MGIEPTALCLEGKCSTTELRPLAANSIITEDRRSQAGGSPYENRKEDGVSHPPFDWVRHRATLSVDLHGGASPSCRRR